MKCRVKYGQRIVIYWVNGITEPLKNVSSVVVLERKNIAPMKTGALICYEATLVLSEGTGPQFFLPAFRPDQSIVFSVI